MVTISDATQRTEISTKEVPIVQTETKTITYESPQVQWQGDLLHCLKAKFCSNNLQLKINHIRDICFSKKLYFLLQLRLQFGYENLSEMCVNKTIFLLKFWKYFLLIEEFHCLQRYNSFSFENLVKIVTLLLKKALNFAHKVYTIINLNSLHRL